VDGKQKEYLCVTIPRVCLATLHPATGVGLDFNSDLVEKILKCKGANYLSVHTPGKLLWASAPGKQRHRCKVILVAEGAFVACPFGVCVNACAHTI